MKLSTIDLNLLVALDAILQTGSVRKAAERVGLSKPAMSHALSRLRSQIGDEILVRSGQEWIPSDRARAIAERVHGLVEEARAVLTPDEAFNSPTLHREFRIHTTDVVLTIFGAALGRAVAKEA